MNVLPLLLRVCFFFFLTLRRDREEQLLPFFSPQLQGVGELAPSLFFSPFPPGSASVSPGIAFFLPQFEFPFPSFSFPPPPPKVVKREVGRKVFLLPGLVFDCDGSKALRALLFPLTPFAQIHKRRNVKEYLSSFPFFHEQCVTRRPLFFFENSGPWDTTQSERRGAWRPFSPPSFFFLAWVSERCYRPETGPFFARSLAKNVPLFFFFPPPRILEAEKS